MGDLPANPAGLILRRAQPSDAEMLTTFNCALAAETEDLQLNPSTVRAGVEGLLAKPVYGFYLVAELDGNVIGQLCITYEWSDWRNGLVWWIQSVYVHKEHRGLGVFTALFRFVRKAALEEGSVCGLRLYVHSENDRAMNVYSRLGMEKTHYLVFEEIWKGL